MERFLRETAMLNYSDVNIQNLIFTKGWREIDTFNQIQSIYNFVRDEILFGYNKSDKVYASQVLLDGYGQCNTKGTLFMALLRSVGIACRVHGFTIDKKLQKGAMTGFVYQNAPKNILHSWVEVFYKNTWFELEGFILDRNYLQKLQKKTVTVLGHFVDTV